MKHSKFWGVLRVMVAISLLILPSAPNVFAMTSAQIGGPNSATLENEIASPASNGSFSLSLTNADAVASGQFRFVYDASVGLQINSVQIFNTADPGAHTPAVPATYQTSGSYFANPNPALREYQVLFYNFATADTIPTGTGAILTFNYTTTATASGTTVLSFTQALLANSAAQSLQVTSINGSFTVNTPATNTPTATNTNTAVPPTATNTPVPPTATNTNTAVPPTATNTPVPPTATNTNTAVPPTATRTNTPVAPTATNTNTAVPPTATRTNTPIAPTATKTNTPIAPTATKTNTPIAPTATKTNTPIAPTATKTNTPIAPTATKTNTPIAPTATKTNTPIAPTATKTNTPIAPTATKTNTPVPPTATKTPVPPTATPTTGPTTGKANITFIKRSEPKSIQDFTYYGAFGTFVLDNPAVDDGDAALNSITYSNVSPGVYSFSEAHQASWELSAITCTPSARATVDLANRSVTLQPQAGDNIVCTFVNERLANIEVRKFNDVNGDKVKQSTEPYLQGWDMGIYSSSNQLLFHAVTDANGLYSKTNLGPDTYKVCETPQSGWNNSLPGTLDATLNKPCYTVTLNPGQNASILFGNRSAALSTQGQSVTSNAQGVKISNLPDINEAPTYDPTLSRRVLFLPVVSK